MSLITRCPVCGTMFKVVPDQLRISEGWVRCGHCSDVFDASAHLMPEADAAPATASTRPSENGGRPDTSAPADAPAAAAMGDVLAEPTDDFESSIHTGVGDEAAPQEVGPAEIEAEKKALAENPLDAPFVLLREDPAEETDEDLSPGLTAARPVAAPPAPDADVAPEPDPDEPSFMRAARRRAGWQRIPWRSGMTAGLAGLALLLVLQVSVHERDRLAAMAPALAPLLEGLCAPFGCQVSPLRQIDAIAIETSSFNRLRGDAFRLQVTLRNQARLDVAMPALELTLTDGQDQPVVRRVLTPGELQHPGLLAGASEWTGSYTLAVAADGANPRIAGYRLLAFYP